VSFSVSWGRNEVMRAWRLQAAVAVVLMAVLLTGCPRKPPAADSDPWGQAGESDVFGEDGVVPGSSLDRYRRGLPQDGDDASGAMSSPLNPVFFGYDSFELTSTMRDVLKENADWLGRNPNAVVSVEGHCDERGTGDYNLALGGRRARAVREYLIALGISAERMSTISYGKEFPICHEASESCWSRNRRVQFVVNTAR